jgi:N-hydroxyarylamine O-acetyltransferase
LGYRAGVIDVDAYLARIGAERPVEPDLAALRMLQERHLRSVPFENLSVILGEPIVLEPEPLVAKLLRGRGGFCYECNGAFAALLTELGYRVELRSAQVYGDEGELGVPLGHLSLRVELAEPWLVDVGFGQFARYPLRLDGREPQRDPEGEFRLTDVEPGVLDVTGNGILEYRLELRPRRLPDFVPTCWWNRTSADSHFTRSLICTLPTADGRITLSGNRLIRTVAGRRTECELAEADLLPAYREHFGLTLDRAPVIG